MRCTLIFMLFVPLTGCGSLPVSCPGAQQAAVQDLLYFGTDKPGSTVSAEEWSHYLEETFTQGFADGFTVWQAAGQWRSAAGETIHEPSYVLSLVHPETAEVERSIQAFIAVYKTRFQQEAVLRVTSDVCVSF